MGCQRVQSREPWGQPKLEGGEGTWPDREQRGLVMAVGKIKGVETLEVECAYRCQRLWLRLMEEAGEGASGVLEF